MVEGKPHIRSAAPVLCTAAMAPMLDCLTRQLGFVVKASLGEPPTWASLARDGVEIMLLGADYPPPAPDWAAYLYVTDVDALHVEFAARGADLVGPPEDKPYNCREFAVRLPDGRILAFAQ
jgi:uncharacterized glyoxalase superfamily protein PhnB